MTTEQTGRPASAYPIVDADVHIHEEPAELAEFAEGTLRQSLLGFTPAERWLDTPGLSPYTLYDLPLGDGPVRQGEVFRTADDLRLDLDRRGVAACICFPGRLQAIATRPEPVYPTHMVRAYNHYLRERWADPARGLFAALLAVPQNPRASAEAIERHADHPGFAAVYLPMAGVYPLWGHRDYEPIYAAAEAAGLPVVLHGFTTTHPTFPTQLDQIETAVAKQVLAQPFCAMANLVTLITGGVLARHPRLRVVVAECGAGWLPPLLWRLDEQYRHLPHELPWPVGRRPPTVDRGPGAAGAAGAPRPSELVVRQVYVTTHSPEATADPHTFAALLRSAGLEDRLLFASDRPHYDADIADRILALPLTDEWKRKVLSENARTAFRLPSGPASG